MLLGVFEYSEYVRSLAAVVYVYFGKVCVPEYWIVVPPSILYIWAGLLYNVTLGQAVVVGKAEEAVTGPS